MGTAEIPSAINFFWLSLLTLSYTSTAEIAAKFSNTNLKHEGYIGSKYFYVRKKYEAAQLLQKCL